MGATRGVTVYAVTGVNKVLLLRDRLGEDPVVVAGAAAIDTEPLELRESDGWLTAYAPGWLKGRS